MRMTGWRRIGLALGLAFAVLGTLGVATPTVVEAQQQYQQWFLQVVGDATPAGLTPITTARVRVLAAGTLTDATIYSDAANATTKTNPITVDANGVATWYGPGTTTSFDVIVVVDSGPYKGTRRSLAGYQRTDTHLIQMNNSGAERVLMVPFSQTTTSAPTTTTFTIPPGAIVKDIIAEVKTGVAGGKMLVGNANIGPVGYCNNTLSIGTSNYMFYCSPTAPTDANQQLHGSSAYALTYHTQNHNASGYLWIYYKDTSGSIN